MFKNPDDIRVVCMWKLYTLCNIIGNNACDLNKCQNGATCIPGNFAYSCTCRPGWTGENCEIDINECESSPCGTYGNCTDLVNIFKCECVDGIKGVQCEININDCKNDSCLNSGACEDQVNDFKCFCPAGFDGKRFVYSNNLLYTWNIIIPLG